MTRSNTVLAVAATLSLAAAAPAVAAEVGAQHTTATAGDRAPLTVPGTGLKKGEKLTKGQTIVARKVTLSGDEKPTTKLTCKSGSVLRGLAPSEGSVGFTVTTRKYVGKRTAAVRAYAAPRAHGSVSGHIYALCEKA